MKKRSAPFSKIYMGLIYLFLYLPIVVMIVFSFNQSKSRTLWTGFTFDWYKKLFTNDVVISALVNTLIIAVLSALIATVLGTFAAIGINNMNKYLRSFVMNATYLPVMNPEIVTGVSLMLLFVFLNMKLGMSTLLIAHITFNLPYVILNVMPKLRQMDSHLYEAALDLGCNPLKAYWKVVLPEIMPGVVSGLLMAFTLSLDDFVISYFTTGPTSQTLPIAIFAMTRKKVSPEINALSTLLFVAVFALLIIINVRSSRQEKRDRKKERLYE